MSATNELIDVLLCEEKIYLRLLSTSEEKRAAITENEPERLQEIVCEETDLLADAGSFEKQREALSEALARQLGIEENRFCLSALAEKRKTPSLGQAYTDQHRFFRIAGETGTTEQDECRTAETEKGIYR